MRKKENTGRLLPAVEAAMHCHFGVEYKIGRFGRTYRWSHADQEWHLSERALVRDRGGWRLQESTGKRVVEQDFAMPASWMPVR